jgi:hypothetical protein
MAARKATDSTILSTRYARPDTGRTDEVDLTAPSRSRGVGRRSRAGT